MEYKIIPKKMNRKLKFQNMEIYRRKETRIKEQEGKNILKLKLRSKEDTKYCIIMI